VWIINHCKHKFVLRHPHRFMYKFPLHYGNREKNSDTIKTKNYCWKRLRAGSSPLFSKCTVTQQAHRSAMQKFPCFPSKIEPVPRLHCKNSYISFGLISTLSETNTLLSLHYKYYVQFTMLLVCSARAEKIAVASRRGYYVL